MKYTIYRRPGRFPSYGVLEGGPWPNGTVVAVTLTLRGARKKAKRHARHGQRPTVETLDL